jgi:uncharacterized protein
VIVVTDTSPLVNLAAIEQIDVLRTLYETILIPQAVYDEVERVRVGGHSAVGLHALEWIAIRPVTGRVVVTALQNELDVGEAEAIALALELRADLLLLDERRGRSVASRFGVRCIGLLGVLIEAKRRGCIPAVKPLIDDLMVRAEWH